MYINLPSLFLNSNGGNSIRAHTTVLKEQTQIQ